MHIHLLLAFQTHIDDPNASWSQDDTTNKGIPVKVHPFKDRLSNSECVDGGCVCGSSLSCNYKSWLK